MNSKNLGSSVVSSYRRLSELVVGCLGLMRSWLVFGSADGLATRIGIEASFHVVMSVLLSRSVRRSRSFPRIYSRQPVNMGRCIALKVSGSFRIKRGQRPMQFCDKLNTHDFSCRIVVNDKRAKTIGDVRTIQ